MSIKKIQELQAAGRKALDTANAIESKAKSESRDMTADERSARETALQAAKAAVDGMKSIRHDQSLRDDAEAIGREIGAPGGAGSVSAKRRGLAITRKSGGAAKLAATMTEKMVGSDGRKALAPAGTVVTNTPVAADVVALGDPGVTILDALQSVLSSTPTYRYLRQSLRTNNAAVVAEGATKPTSIYNITPVDERLKVVAHLSEPLSHYMIQDSASVEQFVNDEMLAGLLHGIENEVINGDGTGEHFTGLLNVSGAQTLAFATDAITTVRKAITKLETAGHHGGRGGSAGLIILNPEDWETIELSRTDTAGQLEMTASPVDRAAKRLWGVQVVTSTALAAGTAIVLDTAAVAVRTDGVIDLRWSEAEGFDTNEVKARCETRAEVDVYQPLGIVIATVVGTP